MAINALVYQYVTNEENYPDNKAIIKEGSAGDWVYVVLNGKVKLKKETPRGMVVLTTLKEGDIFGEIAFFLKGEGKRTFSVIADGPVKIGVIDNERLKSDWQSLSPQLKGLITSLITKRKEITNKVVAMILEETG
jgi:CRP-like cAMP-binding protein